MSEKPPTIKRRPHRKCRCDDPMRFARFAVERMKLEASARQNGVRVLSGEYDCDVCGGAFVVRVRQGRLKNKLTEPPE